MNINLLVLRCINIENTKDFYNQLGLSFVTEKHGDGPLHYSIKIGSALLELYPSKNGLADNLRIGITLDKPPPLTLTNTLKQSRDSNLTKILLNDPDNRTVELYYKDHNDL